MRILIEPSDYVIRNSGDTAMLTIALERIAGIWPDARIQVFTEEPDKMPRPRANVEPLATTGRRLWFDRIRVPRWFRRTQPALCHRALTVCGGLTTEQTQHLTDFYEAVSTADVLIVTGMGGVTSAFPAYAFELLEVVRIAQHFGAKTVMLGQGLGPIETEPLRRVARDVLRRLDLLALRERRAGLPLLKELGVPLERVVVTGDDAIELARRYASGSAGNGIGINMRHASYSGIALSDVENVRRALMGITTNLSAPLVGVPISRVPGEEDSVTIERLASDRAGEVADVAGIRTPEDVIVQLRRCRILVAGSYHAAVFALACGIPTVALAHSPYYVDKFLGLADMFGAGCIVVRLDEPAFAERFSNAVLELWAAAEALRAPLLAATQKQLWQSRAAYARLRTVVR
jgi:polysaccharide pyruvyl transferase WcaK-like protein